MTSHLFSLALGPPPEQQSQSLALTALGLILCVPHTGTNHHGTRVGAGMRVGQATTTPGFLSGGGGGPASASPGNKKCSSSGPPDLPRQPRAVAPSSLQVPRARASNGTQAQENSPLVLKSLSSLLRMPAVSAFLKSLNLLDTALKYLQLNDVQGGEGGGQVTQMDGVWLRLGFARGARAHFPLLLCLEATVCKGK